MFNLGMVVQKQQSEAPHRLLSAVYGLIRSSVQVISTRNRYNAHWEQWRKFLLAIFHHKDEVNSELMLVDECLRFASSEAKLEHIIAFAAYLHLDCKFKKETVGNYLSAIKFYLVSYGINVEFFSNVAVSKILTGMHLTDIAAGVLPDQKKPFPLQMTRHWWMLF
jgi:hypothetical protein